MMMWQSSNVANPAIHSFLNNIRASFYVVILTTIEVYIHKENNTISSIHVKNTINNNSINVNDGTNNH